MNHRTSWKLATTLLTASAAIAIGCNDGSSPTSTGLKPSFAVGEISSPPQPPVLGKLIVCKAGNVNGTFNVTGVAVNGGTVNVSGTGTTVVTGQCKTVAENFNTGGSVGANITVNETSAGLQSITAQRNDNGSISSTSFSNGGYVFLNNFHGYTITYTNVVDLGCTFTQGYYKNHEDVVVSLLSGANVAPYKIANKLVLSADGTLALTAAQVDANLETPPKGGNAFLILTHQLITAELNILGGASVPAAVQTAINSARTLLNGGISASEEQTAKDLAAILDDYNSGITGPGHCSDEEAVD